MSNDHTSCASACANSNLSALQAHPSLVNNFPLNKVHVRFIVMHGILSLNHPRAPPLPVRLLGCRNFAPSHTFTDIFFLLFSPLPPLLFTPNRPPNILHPHARNVPKR